MNIYDYIILSVVAVLFIAAVSFLVFTLLYTPCVAAIATLKAELGSKLHTAGVIALQCVIAWVCAFLVYNLGLLLGL